MTHTERTLRLLRDRGFRSQIVERWIFKVGAPGGGYRLDLFNIIDIVALTPAGVLGVQSCGDSFSEHRAKIVEEHAEETRLWLSTPGCSLILIGWRKIKRKLKDGSWSAQGTYQPREELITLEMIK